jgi:3-deoxy-manno-octulosonate cytidylyltransferase (CMP-KDO synthetase)
VTATVVIPARLHSTRLPRKVLADLGGRTMLECTHEIAVRAACGPVLVVTDDAQVAAEVRAFGGEVTLTSPHHASGTARIAEIAADLEGDVVVNLQADAPFTDPAVVARLAAEARASGAPVTMPVHRLVTEAEVRDPAVVKVVLDHHGRVLLCSRTPVPHVREAAGAWIEHTTYWGHPGLYAYTREFLASFPGLPASPLEDAERLEQLRWLQAGVRLHAFEVPPQGPSIDTPDDLRRARQALLQEVTG